VRTRERDNAINSACDKTDKALEDGRENAESQRETTLNGARDRAPVVARERERERERRSSIEKHVIGTSDQTRISSLNVKDWK